MFLTRGTVPCLCPETLWQPPGGSFLLRKEIQFPVAVWQWGCCSCSLNFLFVMSSLQGACRPYKGASHVPLCSDCMVVRAGPRPGFLTTLLHNKKENCTSRILCVSQQGVFSSRACNFYQPIPYNEVTVQRFPSIQFIINFKNMSQNEIGMWHSLGGVPFNVGNCVFVQSTETTRHSIEA